MGDPPPDWSKTLGQQRKYHGIESEELSVVAEYRAPSKPRL